MTCVGAVRRSGVEVSLSGGTAESSLLMNSSYKSSERCRLASTHLMFVKRLWTALEELGRSGCCGDAPSGRMNFRCVHTLKNGGDISVKQLVYRNISLLCWWKWREAGHWHSPSGRLSKTKRWGKGGGGGGVLDCTPPPGMESETPWMSMKRWQTPQWDVSDTKISLFCSQKPLIQKLLFPHETGGKIKHKMSATECRYVRLGPRPQSVCVSAVQDVMCHDEPHTPTWIWDCTYSFRTLIHHHLICILHFFLIFYPHFTHRVAWLNKPRLQ